MVLGNSKTKRPAYTCVVSEKECKIGAGSSPSTHHPQPVASKPTISVQPMSIEQLLASYKIADEEEEDFKPGFRYLKRMKTEFKSERVKRALNRSTH